MILKDIKQYTKSLKENFKTRINKEDPPQLAIIQVGDVEASNRYVKNKIKDCEEIGIIAHRYWFNENITENELIEEITDLQDYYDGIIVQLPLPPHIRPESATAAIYKNKDVDGFKYDSEFISATPKGIFDYLDYCGFEWEGAHVVVIGRSDIVGKPMAQGATDRNATVTLCHSKTKNLDKHLKDADLIVSAVGKAKFLNCYPIYCPVVDVGINFDENGKMCGDCYNTENRDVTPVPGGVGLLTRCALLENVILAKEKGGNEDAKK